MIVLVCFASEQVSLRFWEAIFETCKFAWKILVCLSYSSPLPLKETIWKDTHTTRHPTASRMVSTQVMPAAKLKVAKLGTPQSEEQQERWKKLVKAYLTVDAETKKQIRPKRKAPEQTRNSNQLFLRALDHALEGIGLALNTFRVERPVKVVSPPLRRYWVERNKLPDSPSRMCTLSGELACRTQRPEPSPLSFHCKEDPPCFWTWTRAQRVGLPLSGCLHKVSAEELPQMIPFILLGMAASRQSRKQGSQLQSWRWAWYSTSSQHHMEETLFGSSLLRTWRSIVWIAQRMMSSSSTSCLVSSQSSRGLMLIWALLLK